MRRLSIVILAAMLAAAVGPSAGLAAKPTLPGYHIRSVTVVAGAPAGVGCWVHVTTTFSMPDPSTATGLRSFQYWNAAPYQSTPTRFFTYDPPTPITVGAAQGVAWGTTGRWVADQWYNEVRLDDTGLTWQWGAQLLAGDVALTPIVLTGTFTGSTTSCPAEGTLLATY
jgi:hypothetical protein